ncbi:ATP-binding protein involved in chromosome partitioning [Scopulibacillus darangshiensis]|uniref:Iron-sulfur cluster carrier protein n=1 Tax=Scopulibacillus darangshiensis TaxID=442528 RepID=A0A4R2NQP5_9BACL|nr:Mrp/NBP35 family ATP-binding protein [Scopulibacillus darangshiensis]TCP24199.1 ATP-binding protein involved in chromosome partitioning [Scopulibacillus darangshiensis]
MLTKDQVMEVLKTVKDPHLHKSIEETNGVREMKITDSFVSLKVALAKINTAEQMKVQQEIVHKLKEKGAESVGLRFEALSEEDIADLGGVPEAGPSLLSKESKTVFIAVASGKGGVGKSTVSVNLAVALQRMGKKVGILDADIYGFSVPDMMGIEDRPKVEGKTIIPVERFGVKVISMGFFVEDNSPVIWRGPMLGKMLNNFFSEVDWGDLDYLILDLPPGTGDVAMDIHTMLPHCKEIIVTTPHPTAAFVAARAGAMAIKTEHDILGVIENMSYFESKKTGEIEHVFGQGGGEKLSEVLGTELLGQIPLGQPYEQSGFFAPSVYSEDHPTGQKYLDIAKKVSEKL